MLLTSEGTQPIHHIHSSVRPHLISTIYIHATEDNIHLITLGVLRISSKSLPVMVSEISSANSLIENIFVALVKSLI